MSGRRRRAVINLALAVGVTVLCLAVAEGALRLAGYDYRPLRVRADDPDQRGTHMLDDSTFVYDPVLLWRPRAGTAMFNELGYRGPVLPTNKPPGQRRLLTIGDSNTLGWGGPAGANWPSDLEQRLGDEPHEWSVLNGGVWGYTSHQGVTRLRELLAWQPDWVLLSFGSNDAHPVDVPDAEFVNSGARRRFERLVKPFVLGRLALGALRAGRRSGGPPSHRVPLADYRGNLEAMVRMAADAGARAALLTRPYIGVRPADGQWKHHAHRYNAETVAVARDLGVPLVDLYSELRDRSDLFADESHFTDQGHEHAAGLILARLRPLLSSP